LSEREFLEQVVDLRPGAPILINFERELVGLKGGHMRGVILALEMILLAGAWFSAGALVAEGQTANDYLAGEWFLSHVSSIQYVNPGTGSYADPSGERLVFRFDPDGHYKSGYFVQSSLYGCTMTIFGYRTGSYTIDGDRLTFTEKTYSLTSKDNCHAEWNYEKHPPLQQRSFRWRLARNQYGPVLVLTGSDGKEAFYARETGKGVLGS
jgi:hypothetical protein